MFRLPRNETVFLLSGQLTSSFGGLWIRCGQLAFSIESGHRQEARKSRGRLGGGAMKQRLFPLNRSPAGATSVCATGSSRTTELSSPTGGKLSSEKRKKSLPLPGVLRLESAASNTVTQSPRRRGFRQRPSATVVQALATRLATFRKQSERKTLTNQNAPTSVRDPIDGETNLLPSPKRWH